MNYFGQLGQGTGGATCPTILRNFVVREPIPPNKCIGVTYVFTVSMGGLGNKIMFRDFIGTKN